MILATALTLLPAIAFAETLTVPQTLYERCTVKQDSGSCYELGDFYQKTKVPANVRKGDEYVLFGCKLEKKRECSPAEADDLRAIVVKGRKSWDKTQEEILQNMPSPKIADELKCENGNADACNQAGIYFLYLAPVTNQKKAEALHEQGCRLGNKSSCEALGLIRKGMIRVYNVDM